MIVKCASVLFLGGILVLGLMVLPVSVHGSDYVATHEESGILSDSYIEFTSDGDFTDYVHDTVQSPGDGGGEQSPAPSPAPSPAQSPNDTHPSVDTTIDS